MNSMLAITLLLAFVAVGAGAALEAMAVCIKMNPHWTAEKWFGVCAKHGILLGASGTIVGVVIVLFL